MVFFCGVTAALKYWLHLGDYPKPHQNALFISVYAIHPQKWFSLCCTLLWFGISWFDPNPFISSSIRITSLVLKQTYCPSAWAYFMGYIVGEIQVQCHISYCPREWQHLQTRIHKVQDEWNSLRGLSKPGACLTQCHDTAWSLLANSSAAIKVMEPVSSLA